MSQIFTLIKIHRVDNCSRKTHLRCDKSSCIPKSKQCDKIQDCEDNLDELKCCKYLLN